MKIDVTQTFKTLGGQVMKDMDESGKAVDATLRLAVVNSLLNPQQKEGSGMDKVKRYELARQVYSNDEVELNAEELTLIKDGIGKAFAPIIVGQAFEMLEGK